MGTLLCPDDLGAFASLYGLREDGVAVMIVEDQKVVVATAGGNKKTTNLVGVYWPENGAHAAKTQWTGGLVKWAVWVVGPRRFRLLVLLTRVGRLCCSAEFW
jgi:hypothetical protein